jgi:FAD/FMN-containing dehydrogenase
MSAHFIRSSSHRLPKKRYSKTFKRDLYDSRSVNHRTDAVLRAQLVPVLVFSSTVGRWTGDHGCLVVWGRGGRRGRGRGTYEERWCSGRQAAKRGGEFGLGRSVEMGVESPGAYWTMRRRLAALLYSVAEERDWTAFCKTIVPIPFSSRHRCSRSTRIAPEDYTSISSTLLQTLHSFPT